MHHAEKAKEIQAWFAARGHEAQPSKTTDRFIGLDDLAKEKQKLREKYDQDAIREHYGVIKDADAVLILNYERHDIPNYIGGNSFLEMGFAHILGKPLYLLNPIPAMPYYETEIIAMRPIVLEGNLERLLTQTG
ncbi:MAG: Maf-like protein [Candidatus Magasanikbacteria bacterium GW2011_GWA2_56_11]|uniref:Maf-like protein n=1 Tax=Candidatus Magasanikbacteria bacterium GW2011_GWA2_56_11 TaxID=1619044 RepID=A0A0G1YDY7_9BACT|nr:MAG: Maf-like protein [Candidatus Magasanikbacteria bacterium GW2011_GWA2_56_11]